MSGRTNIRIVGNSGDGNLATKKESEGERQTGAFSIEDILGGCRKDSGRRGEVLPTLSPFRPPPLPSHLPPPLPSHLPLFHSLPPIFPFLPFAFNSDTRRSSSPAQREVGATFNQIVFVAILAHEHSRSSFPKCWFSDSYF